MVWIVLRGFLLLVVTWLLFVTICMPWLSNQAYRLAHSYWENDHQGSQARGYSHPAYIRNSSQGWLYLLSPTSPTLYSAMTATLSPALFLTAAFGVLAVIGAVASRTKLIDVQKEGLTVRKKGATHGLFVPWEQLSKLEIIDTPDWFGKTNYKLRFHTHNGPTVRISWRDVLTSQQGPPLLNALKTWAPEAIARCNLPVPGLEDTQTNYTQLWLQYFSAPARRERSSDLAAGATIYGGKYQIAGRLSGGGHGTTYLAVMDQAAKTDNDAPKSECDLVIKEYVLPVHRGSLILDRTIEKLNQEAAILRRISHPQIVGLRDSFVEDYRGYLVMEYVQGVSLKDLVDREGPQQESFVCHLAVQMCEILSYLHALTPPVVHRDFTPDNLILQDNLQVKLVDFNVAHELEGSVTATVVGKHSYLPPEQFRGKPVPQSDIYALGCTVFYLLVGADPEPITSSHPQARRAEVSSELDGIIARATALEPKRRYADVDAMKAELVHLLERLPV